MLSTRAWCNPNQILAHYPQNREMNQQALLPATLQEPDPRGRLAAPPALPGDSCNQFYAGKKQQCCVPAQQLRNQVATRQCTPAPTATTRLAGSTGLRLVLLLLPLWKLFSQDTPWSA